MDQVDVVRLVTSFFNDIKEQLDLDRGLIDFTFSRFAKNVNDSRNWVKSKSLLYSKSEMVGPLLTLENLEVESKFLNCEKDFLPYICVGSSGCGKTTNIFRYLNRKFGIYFILKPISSQRDVFDLGSRDLTMGLDDVRSYMFPIEGRIESDFLLDKWNKQLVKFVVFASIATRLQTLLVLMENYEQFEPKHWLYSNLFPYIDKTDVDKDFFEGMVRSFVFKFKDVFDIRQNQIEQKNKILEKVISELKKLVKGHLGELKVSNNIEITIFTDEAQKLMEMGEEAFFLGTTKLDQFGENRPLMSPIFDFYIDELPQGRATFVGTGFGLDMSTELLDSAMNKRGTKTISSVFTNFPMLNAESVKDYLCRFFQNIDSQDMIFASKWLTGRARFAASFVSQVLSQKNENTSFRNHVENWINTQIKVEENTTSEHTIAMYLDCKKGDILFDSIKRAALDYIFTGNPYVFDSPSEILDVNLKLCGLKWINDGICNIHDCHQIKNTMACVRATLNEPIVVEAIWQILKKQYKGDIESIYRQPLKTGESFEKLFVATFIKQWNNRSYTFNIPGCSKELFQDRVDIVPSFTIYASRAIGETQYKSTELFFKIAAKTIKKLLNSSDENSVQNILRENPPLIHFPGNKFGADVIIICFTKTVDRYKVFCFWCQNKFTTASIPKENILKAYTTTIPELCFTKECSTKDWNLENGEISYQGDLNLDFESPNQEDANKTVKEIVRNPVLKMNVVRTICSYKRLKKFEACSQPPKCGNKDIHNNQDLFWLVPNDFFAQASLMKMNTLKNFQNVPMVSTEDFQVHKVSKTCFQVSLVNRFQQLIFKHLNRDCLSRKLRTKANYKNLVLKLSLSKDECIVSIPEKNTRRRKTDRREYVLYHFNQKNAYILTFGKAIYVECDKFEDVKEWLNEIVDENTTNGPVNAPVSSSSSSSIKRHHKSSSSSSSLTKRQRISLSSTTANESK